MKEKGVARFSKISFMQFERDYKKTFPPEKENGIKDINIKNIYENILMPKRATVGSAGYDIFSPIELYVLPKQTIIIPTGIRCYMENDIVLMIYPRSSLGFKYRMMLENTVGIIDSDYYNSENEGHIFIKFTNHGEKEINIKEGFAFAQGVFSKYYLTYDDKVLDLRNGGLGSTSV